MASSAPKLDASPVLRVQPLGFPFATADPFLFAVYHDDRYPKGNPENMFAPRRGNGADFDCASRGGVGAGPRGGRWRLGSRRVPT